MNILCKKLQPQIPLDRVQENDLVRELIECFICHGLLWYPVACKTCETPFCSTCIQLLQTTKSEPFCPHGCPSYTERKCPPSIVHILTNLQINCRYHSNGCSKILSYNELEKHEETCDYQFLSCIGCEQEIIKKDFDEHKKQCPLLVITCDECSTSYKRKDQNLHTLTECLRIQLQQQKSKTQQLEMKIHLMEQKFKEYDHFGMVVLETTNEIKNMLDKPNELIVSLDHNEAVPVSN